MSRPLSFRYVSPITAARKLEKLRIENDLAHWLMRPQREASIERLRKEVRAWREGRR